MDEIKTDSDGRQTVEPNKRTRRQWSAREKRQIVREAQKPGAVRQEVARRHGVHASVLNRWCTEQRAGLRGVKKAVDGAKLLPVRVHTAPPSKAQSRSVAVVGTTFDAIEVEFSSGRRLSVRGVVDAGMLRAVLQELSQ